jgi:hypothetical protein
MFITSHVEHIYMHGFETSWAPQVDVVCYSEYLSNRDEKDFDDIFKFLEVKTKLIFKLSIVNNVPS